jgi:16S rRNA (cytosine1402-N4)-methyltransferase
MKSDLQTPLDLEEIDFSHIPVLSQEVITGLNIQAGGNYLDLTIGGGGHSRLIL